MTTTWIGRCKRCKVARRFEASIVNSWSGDRGYGRKTWKRELDVTGAFPFAGHVMGSGKCDTAFEDSDRPGAIWLRCTCGKSCEFKRLRGSLNVEKKCGARCMSATGNDCECQCAGRNHGANHA